MRQMNIPETEEGKILTFKDKNNQDIEYKVPTEHEWLHGKYRAEYVRGRMAENADYQAETDIKPELPKVR